MLVADIEVLDKLLVGQGWGLTYLDDHLYHRKLGLREFRFTKKLEKTLNSYNKALGTS